VLIPKILLSIYALHVLNHRHQCSPTEETIELSSPARKGTRMNCLESCHIQLYQQTGLLVEEWSVGEVNPLHGVAHNVPA
jgi:hypothetical protein